MDPWAALVPALRGDTECRDTYNRWTTTGGFQVVVKVRKFTRTWFRGIRRIRVARIGAGRVYGTDYNDSRVRVSVPFAALEVDD